LPTTPPTDEKQDVDPRPEKAEGAATPGPEATASGAYSEPLAAVDERQARDQELAEARRRVRELEEAGAKELEEGRAKEVEEARAKELAEARAKELAEARAKELAAAREKELAEAREEEVAEARRARELAEAREKELAAAHKKELDEAHRATQLAEAREMDLTEARRAKEEERREERERRELTLAMARYRRYRTYLLGGLAVTLILAGLAVVSQLARQDLGLPYRETLIATICLSTGAFLLFVGSLVLPVFLDARRVERLEEKRAREAVAEAVEELADAKDLAALIRANRKQMEAYDVLARGQASSAFRNSQVAMGAGLLVLLLGAVIAIGTDNTVSKITTASLTALGGALSGFIARTFLQTYRQALRQLNFYFQQPLINSYLLSAQRLINEMTKGERDSALSKVIANLMDVVIRLPWSGAELERSSDTGSKVTAAGSNNA
jgi:hypothetical protein